MEYKNSIFILAVVSALFGPTIFAMPSSWNIDNLGISQWEIDGYNNDPNCAGIIDQLPKYLFKDGDFYRPADDVYYRSVNIRNTKCVPLLLSVVRYQDLKIKLFKSWSQPSAIDTKLIDPNLNSKQSAEVISSIDKLIEQISKRDILLEQYKSNVELLKIAENIDCNTNRPTGCYGGNGERLACKTRIPDLCETIGAWRRAELEGLERVEKDTPGITSAIFSPFVVLAFLSTQSQAKQILAYMLMLVSTLSVLFLLRGHIQRRPTVFYTSAFLLSGSLVFSHQAFYKHISFIAWLLPFFPVLFIFTLLMVLIGIIVMVAGTAAKDAIRFIGEILGITEKAKEQADKKK